ncbi:hypothetical protein TIFTF001_017202 [Ficus carica]|uniref:Uncharacterized protein n=1 Tax=Ficus carica TaxID=3494 RepID=A0AA88AA48_FICCA|nr:hypothetical protein TIFTF001_017202 [Ficus carica]
MLRAFQHFSVGFEILCECPNEVAGVPPSEWEIRPPFTKTGDFFGRNKKRKETKKTTEERKETNRLDSSPSLSTQTRWSRGSRRRDGDVAALVDLATTVEDLGDDNGDVGSRPPSIFNIEAIIFFGSGGSLGGCDGVGFLLPSPTEQGLIR